MASFMIRFFLCNVPVSGMVGILFLVRRIFRNSLSSRMQYNLWFLLLGLLFLPFLPLRLMGIPQILWWLSTLAGSQASPSKAPLQGSLEATSSENASWITDLALSVHREAPPFTGYLLWALWIAGMVGMTILTIQSFLRLGALKKSALPLQNPTVRRLYESCLKELGISRTIPIYSTAFLSSPVIVGLWKPCIYLPISLLSDCHPWDMRYMLLHELQHYRHRDALGNYFMSLAGILYWFNPFIWYAQRVMRNDQEVACDTSVLDMLEADDCEAYGYALLRFAEKVSRSPSPFAAGLGGAGKQLEQRILHIASYKKPTLRGRLKSLAICTGTAALLLGLAPLLSTYAADNSHYSWEPSSKHISYTDFSAYFGAYQGSFVLYDFGNNAWIIHDLNQATLRFSPNSTYKIYDALFGLEEGILSPEDSLIPWNGESYPLEAWNAPQTLASAMRASVNWYFQEIDAQLGTPVLHSYIEKIGYGNKDISQSSSPYWLESSLKISPIEQVELLTMLSHNSFGFAPENIQAVKDSIHLSSSPRGAFYGKTGTGRVDGKDVNGWFVGFLETPDNTYFFATHISAHKGANGSRASEITRSILSDQNLYF
ncbi:MAG: BlaR1 family beta-lactam sensor/signal transducer [Lachnospiraceae bacterium]|nr:BlaR1 family beta-lactam sensor/signal transducer [Lachnospiraceae bacterium]